MTSPGWKEPSADDGNVKPKERGDIEYILPLITNSCDLASRRQQNAVWEQSFLLNEDFTHFFPDSADTYLLLELVDFVDHVALSGKALPKECADGWHRCASPLPLFRFFRYSRSGPAARAANKARWQRRTGLRGVPGPPQAGLGVPQAGQRRERPPAREHRPRRRRAALRVQPRLPRARRGREGAHGPDAVATVARYRFRT